MDKDLFDRIVQQLLPEMGDPDALCVSSVRQGC